MSKYIIFAILSLGFLTPQFSKAVCVSKGEAKLYKGPHRASRMQGKVTKYTPLKLTGRREGGFVEAITFENQKGWIAASKVSVKKECLQVRVKKSLLRTGPGPKFPKANFFANLKDSFLDLGGEDGWTMVENPKGERAWINLDHIWKPASVMRMSFEPN